MNEWNIQSRSRSCQVCAKSFADKEHYHTLLLTAKHELERMDVCIPCWESKYAGEKDREGFISHWQGLYHAPVVAVVTEPIQKESAETLLRKLIEANDPKHGPACYILAVMLERKRLLKVKEQIKREGARVFVYEHPGSGDIFTITDPNLQLNQLEAVQRDVGELLAHGLPAAPVAAPVVAEAAPVAPTETSETQPAPQPEAAQPEAEPSVDAPPPQAVEPAADPISNNESQPTTPPPSCA